MCWEGKVAEMRRVAMGMKKRRPPDKHPERLDGTLSLDKVAPDLSAIK